MLGGLGNYAQIESLDIMRESVKNPGMNSMNQAGMGLGMGLGMGNMYHSYKTKRVGIFATFFNFQL